MILFSSELTKHVFDFYMKHNKIFKTTWQQIEEIISEWIAYDQMQMLVSFYGDDDGVDFDVYIRIPDDASTVESLKQIFTKISQQDELQETDFSLVIYLVEELPEKIEN